jgi:threonine synthase
MAPLTIARPVPSTGQLLSVPILFFRILSKYSSLIKRSTRSITFCAADSTNWTSILAQTVYYFLAYFSLRCTMCAPLWQFVVPTGNFGIFVVGYYAKRMGLPVENFVIAINENNILARF